MHPHSAANNTPRQSGTGAKKSSCSLRLPSSGTPAFVPQQHSHAHAPRSTIRSQSHRVQSHVMGFLLRRTSLVVVVVCKICFPSSSLVTHTSRCCLHVCLVVMSFCSVARGVQRGCSQTVVSASFVRALQIQSSFFHPWSSHTATYCMVPQKQPTVPQII